MSRDRCGKFELPLKLIQKQFRRRLGDIQELARKGELGAIHCGHGRNPGDLRRSTAETQEDPGEVVQPTGTHQPGSETIL